MKVLCLMLIIGRRAAYQSVTEHPIFSSSAAFRKEAIGAPGSHGHASQPQHAPVAPVYQRGEDLYSHLDVLI